MIVRKTFYVELCHRLQHSYTRRCQGLHGHSYRFEVFLSGQTQDKAQMLMDFSLISDRLGGFIDAYDHSLLVFNQDSELVSLAPKLNERHIILPYNPTAEQIARHIYYFGKHLELPMHKVVVHETPNGCAEFSGDDPIGIDLEAVVYSKAILDSWP